MYGVFTVYQYVQCACLKTGYIRERGEAWKLGVVFATIENLNIAVCVDLKSFLHFDIVVLARQCIPVFQPVGSLASVRFHTYFVEPVDIAALGSMCKK